MKTFKISKQSNKVLSTANLYFDRIVTSGETLCLITDKENATEIIPGGHLCFEKSASGSSGQLVMVCERDVLIKDVIYNDGKAYVYFEYPYIRDFTISSVVKINTGTTGDANKYKIYLTEEHGMVPLNDDRSTEYVPEDFNTYVSTLNKNYTVYVRRGENIMYFTSLELCYPNSYLRGANIFGSDGECCPNDNAFFDYDTMERNSLLANYFGRYSGTEFFPEPGDTLRFCTNQYFFTDGRGIVHTYENVKVLKYTDFMGLNVVLDEDYDAKRMFEEYQVNNLFVKKIKESIIPDFIDLEKVKYAPAYSGDTEVYLATGLTFNLHFRTRVMDEMDVYKFDPTWHLNELEDTWNNNGIDSVPIKRNELYNDTNFVNSSNLIGYLDFTDDDIYNQKNRVKQSFLRLSFYDSPSPLEQSLLYYSTIFLDGGDLFGKFVKRKAWLEEIDDDYNQEDNPVVWSPTGETDPVPAVTSQLTVNDEYDMTRSGEGFNLYLFRQDAPIENYPQDIYMKVEFNHAGNGRTIPLIFWKMDENSQEPVKLSTKNYFDNLYIKIKIALTDKGYVYTFPELDGNGIVWNDDRLVFNLFEPRLELETEEAHEPLAM